MLAVVHDRYFIDRFATGLWGIDGKRVRPYADLETCTAAERLRTPKRERGTADARGPMLPGPRGMLRPFRPLRHAPSSMRGWRIKAGGNEIRAWQRKARRTHQRPRIRARCYVSFVDGTSARCTEVTATDQDRRRRPSAVRMQDVKVPWCFWDSPAAVSQRQSDLRGPVRRAQCSLPHTALAIC